MSSSEEITCQDSISLVSQLRDQELTATDAQKLQKHLSNCSRCQAAKRQFEILFYGLDELLARKVAR